jgi:uncharacterized beta-barrel protein YwiB (DUF1934 family)
MEKKMAYVILSSFIKDDTTKETNESKHNGTIEITERGYRLYFDEEQEGVKINTRIMITDSIISLTKTGGIQSSMRFVQNVLTKSEYSVSGYSFDCDIFTKKITLTKGDNSIKLNLAYEIKIGGAIRESTLSLVAEF